MIERARFSEGLTRLGLSIRQTYSPEEQSVFHDAIGPCTDAEEWDRFTRAVIAWRRWRQYLPTVPDLMDALDEFRGAPPLNTEAVAAYERVLSAGTYSAEGTSWNYRDIAEKCGRVAAQAFLAAGGHTAFATTFAEDKRRRAFVEEYVSAARERPEERLLPPGEQVRALPEAR